MSYSQQKLILRTLETILQLQLRSVRQLLGEEEVEKSLTRRLGMRRQSLVDLIVRLLDDEKRALHVNEMVDLLRQRYGRVTDRDTISSSLSKKARQGVLVRQTAPATFALINK